MRTRIMVVLVLVLVLLVIVRCGRTIGLLVRRTILPSVELEVTILTCPHCFSIGIVDNSCG